MIQRMERQLESLAIGNVGSHSADGKKVDGWPDGIDGHCVSPSCTGCQSWVHLDDDSWLLVMTHLDPISIIRLRQVNRRIYKLTHEQSVWIHQLEILREQMVVPDSSRNGKDCDLAPEEIALRCIKLEKIWTGRRYDGPRTRTIDVLRSGIPYSLVTGIMLEDRPWLLTAERKCSFHLWDLSVENPIPLYVGKHPDDLRAWYYELHRDRLGEVGRKEMIMATMPLLGSGRDVRRRIDIFRFDLVKRRITFLGSISFRHQILTFRIYGEFILVTTMDPRYHIELVNWTQAVSGDEFEYWEGDDPYPDIPSQGLDAHLLPDMQVIACFDDHIALYSPPSFQTVSTSDFQSRPYNISSAMLVVSLSDLQTPGPTSSFVTTLKRREKAFLRIYQDEVGNFQAVSREFQYPIRSMYIGFHRTLVVTEDNQAGRSIHFVTTDDIFSPPSEAPITIFTPGIKVGNVFGVEFCEATGTICLFDTARIDVHDFVL